MFVTSKIVVGQIGYRELAAVGIAGDISFEILIVVMGLLSIVGVLCAQAEGAGQKKQAGLAVRQGFIVSVIGYQQIQQQLEMLPEFNWLAMTALDGGLIVIVLLSVLMPAWRVISSDPMQALREE